MAYQISFKIVSQSREGNNKYIQGVECYNGQATCDTAVTDVVTGDVTQENCKDGCEALPNGPNACNAYTYISNSAAPHLGQPVCYLWKKCKEDLYDTEQESEMRCIGNILF